MAWTKIIIALTEKIVNFKPLAIKVKLLLLTGSLYGLSITLFSPPKAGVNSIALFLPLFEDLIAWLNFAKSLPIAYHFHNKQAIC